MKKILLFTDTLNNSSGGMEVHQAAFIKFFTQKSALWIVSKKTGIILHHNGIIYDKFKNLRSFLRWLKAHNAFDIFFFNNLSWIRQTPLLRQCSRNTLFVIRSGGNDILRAPFEDDTIPLYIRQGKIVDYINHNIDFLIVNSDYSYLRNIKLGINACKMVKIRGGVDSKLLEILKSKRKILRAEFDKVYNTYGKKILTIACRMVDFKGIPEFIDYYKLLDYSKFFLVLIGDGKLGVTVKQKLSQELEKDNYVFMGETEHEKTLEYIVISDVIINSAIYCHRYFEEEFYIHTETMGRTMLEACVAGIPLIATDVGGTNELFQENLYVGEMITSWDNLSEEFIANISQKQVKIKKDYSWENIFGKYSDLFTGQNSTNIYVLDIDNTILRDDIPEKDIADILKHRKRNSILVLNTARGFPEKPSEFTQQANADVVIVDNGMEVYYNGVQNTEWDTFVKDNLFIDELTKTCSEMQKEIPGTRMKVTHPNSFVIWKDELFSDNDIVERLKKYFNPSHFQLILTSRHIKLLNRRINKQTATEFVIKNHKPCFSIGAGDSSNDIGFCSICDLAFVDISLIKEMPEFKNAQTFTQSEVGKGLLERIFRA